jgi:hypothetical protein
MAAARSSALRALLIERFPDAVTLPERSIRPLPTGIDDFDRILPKGGLPRGRLVVWERQTGGATALLRAACFGLQARGERVAWIDGNNSFGSHWVDGPIVLRPSTPDLALRAAEILLRSGGFALVVLTGVDPDQTRMLRLSRMVHEGEGAFVALTERTLTASLRIASSYLPDRFRWALGPFGDVAAIDAVAIRIVAKAPGWLRETVLFLPALAHDLRLSLEPDLADRRGQLD